MLVLNVVTSSNEYDGGRRRCLVFRKRELSLLLHRERLVVVSTVTIAAVGTVVGVIVNDEKGIHSTSSPLGKLDGMIYFADLWLLPIKRCLGFHDDATVFRHTSNSESELS